MKVACLISHSGVRLNLTPMIDVTFQLILFFLLAGHLAQQESRHEIELPYARSAERLPETPGRRLVINVLPDGGITLGAEPVNPTRLAEILAVEKGRGELPEIRIRTDRRTAYGQITPILTACARQGLWNVSFSVLEAEGSGSLE